MMRPVAEPHRLTVRVYYEDTDFSGVVYHASYLRFLERGRTEFLRACGVAQADMRDGDTGRPIGFAVRRITIEFLQPARMDDLVIVTTRLVTLGGASLDVEQSIERDGVGLITAEVRVALVCEGRPRRLPAGLRALIAKSAVDGSDADQPTKG